MKMKKAIFLTVAIIVIVGLFFIIKPKPQTETQSGNKTFELVVIGRKLVDGQSVLQATEGDNVTIKITVDEPEELHLHGYDKHVDLEKGVQGELTFTANLTGRFPFELENSK